MQLNRCVYSWAFTVSLVSLATDTQVGQQTFKYLNEENENSLGFDILLTLSGLLGHHRLVAESKQVKWFPHQPLLLRQQ